ncbi:membrane protein [Knoellia flava TL1]|uniref:Membrane protein n=2 Tax=Knoellia flava TaxID=913969 RepID=A0A8H9KSE4_9MICO|nr:MMPL family transporter [Knoellia flava]KGN31799.1 membrane protein [Knoellia flava TL1]GGB89081.1 membrane protein [Knoellia flava]
MTHRRGAPESRRPRRVILGALVVLVAWLAVGAVGGPATGRLSEVQKNDNASFLPTDAESTAVLEAVGRFSDDEEIPLFLVAEDRDGGELDERDAFALLQLGKELPSIPLPGLDRTLGDYLVEGAQIVPVPSEDRKAALVVIPLTEAAVSDVIEGEAPIVAAAEEVRTKARVALSGTGMTTSVGGPGGLVADFSAAFAGIDGVLLLVALAVVLVILLVVYRSPILPIAVLLSAVFGLALAVLVVRPLAENGAIELSGQSQGIMFILVVGAATDYALLLVSRFREELHEHDNTWTALRRAWRGSVEPIVASAATVILGLLCLMLASLRNTAGLGPVGAFGVAGALLASLTFLPAVLLLFGRKAFWPFAPRVDHHHAEDAVGTRSLWGRVSGLVGRHPRRTWVVTLAVLLAAAAFAPTFRAEGVTIKDTFLVATDSVDAQEALERHFAAGAGSPVQVVVPEDRAEAVRSVLEDDPGIESAWIGVQPPVPGQPAPEAAPVDGLQLVQGTATGAADSPEAEETVRRLRVALDDVSPDAHVGGQAAINLDVLEASGRDLRVIVPAILVVIFLVLCVLLRSLVAPLLLVVANVVSFAATIGVSALVFNHVLGFGGSDPAIPLYGFVFLVALGIDYSIFLMTRVREESVRRGTRPGILVGLAVTGGVITSAGIVLAATFSSLTVLPLVFLVQVAFIVAFGVILDTFVVRSLLVPALAHDIGPKVWWPARLRGERAPSRVADPAVEAGEAADTVAH